MPQQTNLNVSPYFDDFDANKNYYKVLFKPGYPVQARELTTLQSILQNQVEQFGNHIFKEGSIVIPGQINYNNEFNAVKIENSYLGVDVELYVKNLVGRKIIGETSRVEAKIVYVLSSNELENEYTTLYVSYLASGLNDRPTFLDNEKLILDEAYSQDSIIIQSGEGFANTTIDSTSVGSAVILSSGVYFLRGTFVNVDDQILILDAYSNTPSYKVGLDVIEEFVTSDDDNSLTDNAQGFSNYAAPGADRFKITAILSKIEINTTNTESFVGLLEIRNGNLIKNLATDPTYNILQTELARRTSDESGDYYVRPFDVSCRETLNDNLGNNGVFQSNQLTYNNNTPNENLATYKISAGKAYVRGYEVNIPSTVFVDFEKPRTTNLVSDANLVYYTGPTYTLNNVYGAPNLNLSQPFVVSLRDSRVGLASTGFVPSGKEIGLARVYDFALESGSYNASNARLNEWDISLFDIDTYTEISLNESVTLTTPTFIKGKSSGATAHLRFNVNNAGILTAYGVNGSFVVGEKFIFNGVETTSRVSTAITDYSNKDVKSLSQYNAGIGDTIFTADIVPSSVFVGFASVTARSAAGISSISLNSDTEFSFINNAKVGALVAYTISGTTVPTFSQVTKVEDRTITVTGITTVTGICEGSPPSSATTVNDLSILESKFQSSTDNTLYTPFAKSFVQSVDLTDSSLTIRKEFAVTITSNQSNTISAELNEFFLPFDEERYVLIRSDGTFEALSQDKFVFDEQAKQLTIYGLGTNDSSARLIATLRKSNVKSKVKVKNRIKSLIVDKSKYDYSGIGSTTLNDGLTYGSYPYGTRVQDEDICLNVPDVTKIYAIFESSTTTEALLPTITFSSLSGPTAKTTDLLVGEHFIGKTSGAIGIYVKKNNDYKIDFIYLNDKTFQELEVVTFEDSGISAVIQTVSLSDKNITSNYTLNYNQKETLYDYANISRNPGSKEPTKQIKIIFESASYLPSDFGDLTVANSYDQFDYCDIVPVKQNLRGTDILDIRPRVSDYTVSSGSRSPFEFLSRTFSPSSNSGKNILASDESITLSYQYYLGRIDRIFLSKNGIFQLKTGDPSEAPQLPQGVDDALEIATAFLPPYLCNVKDVSITLFDHKRYQMKDISKLEDRIKNLETYTTLNLLEVNTQNFSIKDVNGLDRFKSGFFVDNFTTTTTQNKSAGIKNSIDTTNTELRSAPYTTEIDLLIGSKSLIGIGQSVDPLADSRYVTDLVGNNIRRTGQLITLDYTNVEYVIQPYATRTENVTPYLVTTYNGTIDLFPSSDNWVDQVRLDARTVEIDNFTATQQQLQFEGFDPQTGFGPITWGQWETTWTGVTRRRTRRRNIITTTTQQQRQGTRLQLTEQVDLVSQGDSLVSSEVIPFMRSRNVEFTGKRFRPFTQVYSFFDNENVNDFVFPKLLEITMQSGVFSVGETVVGLLSSDFSAENLTPGVTPTLIKFRVASANHKYGPFNNPTDIFTRNPYNQQNVATFPSVYSSTSTLLNIDTSSLAELSSGSFYGRILPSIKLKGQTSGAEAIVNNVRLVTDNVGTVIGSFLIPNPNVPTNPSFETGVKTFRLTSDSTNSSVEGNVSTSGEQNYQAQGLLNTVQETVLSIRSPKIKEKKVKEEKTEVTVRRRRRDPLAQSFFVDNENGIFVTKLDLYLRTKDDTLPLIVQLRPMTLGLPTEEVYPFSEVIVDSENINLSEDASVATTITFPSPVYLRGNQEHALVLLSDSNSYTVWISRLGETDISTVSLAESQRIVVYEQPTLGSLFKSQNGSTWNPSQYEDLKFTLYNAQFSTSPGNISFYNPELTRSNNQIANLLNNSIELNSKKVRVGLGTTVQDSKLVVGNTILQLNSTATGNYVGSAGSATGTLTLVNTGIGYSDGAFTNLSLSNVTGSGANGTANITITNGVAVGATINFGGNGYRVGDVLTITNFNGSTIGQNLRLSVAQISGVNELIIDNVQGNFTTGAGSTIAFIATGIGQTNLNGTNGNVTVSSVIVDSEISDGLHIKVNHKNHGMYALNNSVTLSDVYPDNNPTTLATAYDKGSSGVITLSNMLVNTTTGLSIFEKFENVSVSSTNPGYIRIENEIISYEGVSGSTLTGITRQIDQTKAFSYTSGTPVFKYELDGISLRRINKTHTLQDVGFTTERAYDLNYYYLKIDTSANGVDRTSSASFAPLYINETKSAGGPNITATQNIPFEIARSNIKTMNPIDTSITGSIRTTSGSSVDGSEESYNDLGFEPLNLFENTYFSSPRIVASKINESEKLSSLPGNKSLTVNLKLESSNEDLSPVIDLDRTGLILVSNRVNSPIENYATDPRVSTLKDDPSAFVYATNPISLEVPASSIKIIVSAYVNQQNDLRALYSILKDPAEDPIYYPFPGYNNLNNLGQVIDVSASNGLSDKRQVPSDNYSFLSEDLPFIDYEFTVNNLPDFRYFSIKLIGSSTNMAYPPRIRDLRVIALA